MSTIQAEVPDTLFISHASKDKKYAKELINLLTSLQIPNIVCSSLEKYQIPNDVDIYDYLKDKLSAKTKVVFLLSENYYESAACLNEMGACWVLNNNYTAILTPNFEFNQIQGAINPNQMSFKLSDESRLCSFFEGLMDEFHSSGLPTLQLAELVKETALKVNEIAYEENVRSRNTSGKIEQYKFNNEKLKIALRLMNPTTNRISISSIILTFIDNTGHEFSHRIGVDMLLHKQENRIEYFEFDYNNSLFNPITSPLQHKVDLVTNEDYF